MTRQVENEVPDSRSVLALVEENSRLHMRLAEAEETLQAIRTDEVDALVVQSVIGPKVYTLQGLDAETMRFRGEMLAQVSDAVIAVDRDERITYINAAAEKLYGVTTSRALGNTLQQVYDLRWLNPTDEVSAHTALGDFGEWRGENIHIRSDARELNVESSLTVLRNIGGDATGRLAVVRDITERKLHENKLQVSEVRYRRLFEAAHDGILIIDPATSKIIDANPFMTQLLGYPHSDLIGKELFEIGLWKDEHASQDMFAKLKLSGQVRYENLPLERVGGEHQDVEVVANLYEENGRSVIQCNIRDISERRRSEAHVEMLMAEVNHRAKNLLAVVQAVAYQTARQGDPATLMTRLSERINGLAVGQDLLVKNQWHGVDVADLVRGQLAHFADLIGTRVSLSGPKLRLTSEAAQAIGMALHELATNAVKYGALSNQEGCVDIAWQTLPASQQTFDMSWVESGGPAVSVPTHKGFGHTIIGRLVEASVQGVTQIKFEPSGLMWRLTAPLDNAVNPGGPASVAV
ncbi:sensory box protein [Asticcacaulis biprosthecium C19]|uniref:histidine kinase n=1 Tax=Asticcacaulis biprosthecium C19 TaxID=715226 RepID=F4QQI7_9CAUL|nr:PAS domain S-box protein [Asticcacaulis biprosthecium]EGF90474.1 sensory box protein [Asticcacaulis biprosthecium C19]